MDYYDELRESRKEDELYYEGPFWIKADTYRDMQKGNFELIAYKVLVNYEGEPQEYYNKREFTHKKLWAKDFKDSGFEYYHYPRGRVNIYKGVVYINLNSKCNTPKIIDAIIKEYKLEKFSQSDIDIEYNDVTQGPHYDFEI